MDEWVAIMVRLHKLLGEDIEWDLLKEDVETLMQIECYDIEGYPKKCFRCGHKHFYEETVDYIDVGVGFGVGQVCESEFFCQLCNTRVAYWSYGYADPVELTGFMEFKP